MRPRLVHLILSAAAFAGGTTHCSAQPAPAAVLTGKPNNIVWTGKTLPGGAPLPPSKPPAKTLIVVDIQHTSMDWQRAALSLQGIVNRAQPEIYCIQSDMDEVWLHNMIQRGWVKSSQKLASPQDLIKRYRSRIKGVIITDPQLPASVNVAFTAAGVENAIVVSNAIESLMKLPVVLDTRGKWSTNVEAYSWAFDRYWPRLNHNLVAVLHPRTLSPRDYVVENKGFVFWITGPLDGAERGGSPTDEARLMERLFAKMPPNTPVLGYPYAGERVGIGETPGVSLFAKFGKYLIATDFDANLSVHSGVRVPPFKQRHPPAPKLDPTKVYISYIVSDGDNLQVYQQHSFPDMWASKDRGTIPVGWSLSPSAAKLVPDIADWFYRAASPKDEFVGAVSGVGYTYPDDYAERYQPADRRRVWNGFLSQTAAAMKQMDMRNLWIMGATRPSLFADYARRIQGLQSLFPDYGRQVSDYSDATFPTANGVPVFRAATNWTGANQAERVQNALQEIHAIVPPTRPAFLHVFAQNWQVDIPTLKALSKALGPEFVAVRPDQMAALYKQHLQQQKILLEGPKELPAVEGREMRMALSARNVTKSALTASVATGGPLRQSSDSLRLDPYESVAVELSGLVPALSRDSMVSLKTSLGTLRYITPIHVTPLSEIVGDVPPGALRFAGRWDAMALPHRSGARMLDMRARSGLAWSVNPAMFNGNEVRAAGFVVYGPYAVLAPGHYVALFRLKRTAEGEGPLARIDAAVSGGQHPLAQRYINADETPLDSYVSIVMPFDYGRGKVETRVEWLGKTAMAIDCITIYQVL